MTDTTPNFIASLGLDKVEADPNALPDSTWEGDIFKSEYVISKNKGTLNHVVTYRVTEGERAGAQRPVWYTLYKDIKNEAGEVPESLNDIKAAEPAMTDGQKTWYKKLWVDLGFSEERIGQEPPEALVGKLVTFKTKKNGDFINVNNVQPRGEVASAPVETGFPSF